MKKSTLIACIIMIIVILAALVSQAQTYRMNKGQIEKVSPKKDSTKTADKVYKIVDGKTFYKGANGGIYWKKKSRSGKTYKVYLQKSK